MDSHYKSEENSTKIKQEVSNTLFSLDNSK